MIPTTVNEAVNVLYASLRPKDIEYIRTNGVVGLQTGAGRAVRNEWGLWTKGPLVRDFVEQFGIAHGDDCSGLLFAWVEAKVQGVVFNPVAFCKTYHDHWKEQGLTALEAANWNA